MPSAVRSRRGCPRGFTLIELMVTVAVVAIIAVVAIPNLVSVVDANRLRSQTDEVVASLQHARSEAIRRNARVEVCRSTNGTACAGAAGPWERWIVVVPELRADGTVVDVVSQGHVVEGPVQLSGSDDGISFGPTGLASGPLALTTCIPTDSIEDNQRVITVMVSGGLATNANNGAGACP